MRVQKAGDSHKDVIKYKRMPVKPVKCRSSQKKMYSLSISITTFYAFWAKGSHL